MPRKTQQPRVDRSHVDEHAKAEPIRPELIQRLKASRPVHSAYLKAMATSSVTFGLGASGTGKTFMAAGFAAQQLAAGRIEKIILSRPLVQCGGDRLGFLPGDLAAKVSPFMAPLLDAIGQFFEHGDISRMLESGQLQVTPLELMRGISPKRAIIVIDEAQNCSRVQMEMALTRMDVETRIVFCGDERQSDIGGSPISEVARQLMTPIPVESVSVVRFSREDNMRSPIVAAIAERLGI